MDAQHVDGDSELIADLMKLSQKSPKLVRSSVYSAPAQPDIKVRSWKMNEYKYNNIPCPFPTLARGLFTQEVDAGNGKDTKYRIAARGYDKFFNIGEVPWTTWSALEAHTGPPYTLTLKSNGCIIFMGALTPSKLVITSKHSLGPVAGAETSHAQRGEWWLRKQFQEKGKTEEQLAKVLWENNWTAVAELCDDSFEEHVLGYSPEKTGLHLHGINASVKAFKTMPPDIVDEFATEWGFIRTPYTTLQSIPEVKAFTDDVARKGEWNGEAVEGFVVRTHVTEPPTKGNVRKELSPYPPGSSFFFKVKFDEPYMMYRDWREVTKNLLSGKVSVSTSSVPKAKMKRPETRLYVQWLISEIKRDREQFDGYTHGHGIISSRERFLQWMNSPAGKEGLVTENKKPDDYGLTGSDQKFEKTIIVPVAVPGCGKTAIAVALVHLFGFGHTQSDDVKAKKAAPVFLRNVVNLLRQHDVVIADKNNHLRQHRQDLREATKSFNQPVRLMALNWTSDQPLATIHRICADRVSVRGENHQSLVADNQGKNHEDVIWRFLNEGNELADDEVDVSVDMNFEDNLEQALDKAIDACVRILGVPKPSKEKVEEALQVAGDYRARAKTEKKIEKALKPPRYFGLLAETDLERLLDARMEKSDVPEAAKAMYQDLRSQHRITKRPHVTIVHSNALRDETDLWERCMRIHKLAIGPLFRFRLGRVVWNSRVMALTVEDVAVDSEGDGVEGEGHEFVSKMPREVRERLHITVGTRNADIKPVEAKSLVQRWRQGREDGDTGSVALSDAYARGRVKGLMQ